MEEGFNIVDNVIYMPNYESQPDPRGIGWVYFECMLKYQDRIAQIDGLTGEEDTFSGLLQRCVGVAIGLRALGVEYGDTISVCTDNHFNSCVPNISAMFVGAKIAALDPSLSHSQAVHMFKISIPKVVFANEESVQLIEDVISEVGSDTVIVVFGASKKYVSFQQLIESTKAETKFRPVKAKSIHDVAVIFFSSGTTGFPKGISHTHYSILRASPDVMKFGKAAALTFSPGSPYWNVFLFYLHHNIRNGTTRVLYPTFDRNDPWKVLTHKLTLLGLSLTDLMLLCNTPKPTSIDTSALELIVTGGNPVSVSEIARVKATFPHVIMRVNYGQSEVFPNILSFDTGNPKHVGLLLKKQNSCGMPKRGISYKVVDIETGKALGPNQKGELCLKTDMQCSRYSNSSDMWDEDGWLRTGDYVHYDEDYCFFIEDRIKEMFKYQSRYIVPAVIEGILATHPAVHKNVVVGKPHAIDVHHPMAVVQLKNGVNVTEEEIQQFVDNRVKDRLKFRGGIKFVKQFPLTPSMKVNRFELKQMIQQGVI